jgi:pimeloyl-ACP methyl ester carboxylesterase
MVEDCGHLSTLEQPGPVNEALETWLEPEFG